MLGSSDYIYTNNWFEDQRPIHEKFLCNIEYVSNSIKILEIGAHEGRSSVFFSKFLVHKDSSLTSIDPFLPEDTTSPVKDDTFQIYKHNIKLTGKESQIFLEKDYSINVLTKLYSKNEKFDYVLIDGSHLSKDVIADAILSFELIKSGGIIFFDDYLGGDINSLQCPKIAIDSFVNCFRDKLEILHVGYHYVIKKL
jgi:predicted O-methyltransferase YrrM